MRAVIYARYSTDLQREASIEDQVRLCRQRIDAEGWRLTATYKDAAISGASRLRPGYQKLLEDARGGQFDIVVAEALDRLSRDQEDVAGLYKQLGFCGVKLITLAEGEISELHVGLKGTMNALFLKDLAAKTRRGLEGRVRQGRSGGGLCYGYKITQEVGPDGRVVPGGRRIDPIEAAVVTRVFRDYASGLSPRRIARTLNAEGIPGPRGSTWTASTIHGNRERGTGILNNELYIGRLIWNRQHFVKDPVTSKRIARPNPPEKWIIAETPDLRIVNQDLWEEVRARQQALQMPGIAAKVRGTLNERHRTRYLFSGLLACGVCGAGYVLRGADRYGCANHVNRGTCANRHTVARAAIERRILAGLRERLLAPELVAEFIREFQIEFNRCAHQTELARSSLERELRDAEARIRQIVAAIEQGIFTVSTKDRLLELEARRETLKANLSAVGQEPARPRLHPGLAEVYRQKVADLERCLNDPAYRHEAQDALRGLIERIVLHPGERRGEVRAELFGELGAIMRLAEEETGETRTRSKVRVSLVAGRGFEPLTFRL